VVGSIPTAPTKSPDDSVDLGSPNTEKQSIKSSVLDRNWTEINGVNPLDGTNYLDTVSAFIEGFLHYIS
jgi:hypothetical protein